MGIMQQALAREEQEWARTMEEEKRRMTDRFASTLVIAALIITAARLAREENIRQSTRLTSVITDSIALAKLILEKIVR